MENNFKDIMPVDGNLQPIMDAIEQIMAIPEKNLTDDNIEVMIGMITGAFTDKIRNASIDEMVKTFEQEGLTRAAAAEHIESSKIGIKEALDELDPSPHKRQIFDGIFSIFYEIFDAALAKYHTYDIELPIKLEAGAHAPTYAHETDACADLYASQDIVIPAHSTSNMVHTGLRIALPESWVLKLEPRSSIGSKSGLRLSNSMGIIDADYRGEICILYDNISDSDYEIKAGDRIAQCWIERVYRFKSVVVDILPASERGEGGFGSTGK